MSVTMSSTHQSRQDSSSTAVRVHSLGFTLSIVYATVRCTTYASTWLVFAPAHERPANPSAPQSRAGARRPHACASAPRELAHRVGHRHRHRERIPGRQCAHEHRRVLLGALVCVRLPRAPHCFALSRRGSHQQQHYSPLARPLACPRDALARLSRGATVYCTRTLTYFNVIVQEYFNLAESYL